MSKGAMFSVLLVCISASCQADTLARDGNGGFVGFYTGIFENGGVVLISSKGFRFVIGRENGALLGPELGDNYTSERIYFENGNCTGGAHLQFISAQYAGVIVPLHGGDGSLQAVYYVAQNAVTDYVVDLNSYLDYPNGVQTCTPVAPTQGIPNVPLLLNDPAVTGVPNSNFVPPITVTSNTIFKNGFDTALAQAASASVFG